MQSGNTSRSTTTTASEDIGTSRQVLPTTKEDHRAETSISTSSTKASIDSRSSANIPSDLSVQDETTPANAKETPVFGSRPAPSLVHGHLLPSGWACKYDESTDEYSFEYAVEDGAGNHDIQKPSEYQRRRVVEVQTPTRDEFSQTPRGPTMDRYECQHGYHFPTSPTSSMISELAKQVQKSTASGSSRPPTAPKARQIGYGKHKLVVPSEEDEQAKRLRDMFPTAPMPIIEQMVRIYHGREGLIKAALISLGYKRSSEYDVQQASAQSPIMLMMSKPSSKKLFDKLTGYFPDKDEAVIKSLMYKHKELEHEIISALVESGQESSRKHARLQLESAIRADRSGAIMKLRYLKFLYPTCEEIELYHLLNCNDLNAHVVMELVEKKGHKRANIEEVLQNRKSQTQQMRAQQAAHAAQDKVPSSATDLVQAHVARIKPTVSEAQIARLSANLKKSAEACDDQLILAALQATDYNESLARKFLQEMEPADDALFRQRYEIPREQRPDVVAFPCKAIQKGDSNFMSIIANESIYIAREVVECENALALLKMDASTFTQEDFPAERFTHRLGRQLGLARGPTLGRQRARAKENLGRGPCAKLKSGSKYEQICQDIARPAVHCKARGHKESLVRGRNLKLQCGHDARLLERTHPFFEPTIPNGA